MSSIHITPDLNTALAGEELSLICTATVSEGDIATLKWNGSTLCKRNNTLSTETNTFRSICSLGKLKQSYSGMWSCDVTVANILRGSETATLQVNGKCQFIESMKFNKMYIILYAVPKIHVRISNMGTPNALRQFTLNCTVSPPPSLGLKVQSYQWFRNDTNISGGNQFHFSKLQPLEEYNVYTCQFRASSKYLNGIVSNLSNEHRIKIFSKYYELNY